MDTLEFLQRVLPTKGFYVTTVINKDGNRQGFFNSVDELSKVCVRSDQTKNNTYYAISAFKTKGNRKQDNVRATKVVALDVDCGETKPYPDWKAGLTALGKFINELELPKPMIIFSGNGLHVYWVLTEELTPMQWKPLAGAMKLAAAEKEFHIDAGLTTNSALVLRPVGTHNPKNGNEVKLLVDAEPVTPKALLSKLTNYMQYNLAHSNRQPRESSLLNNLAVTQEYPPAVGSVVSSKCQQIGWAIKNQKDVPEPLWYSLIGVAAFCVDPEDTAIKWSEGHDSYSESATRDKVIQWKDNATGPTTCDKLKSDRPNGCRGCKYAGKVGSPARLGIQYQEVAITTEVPDKVANLVPIPKPFKRTQHGIKMTIDDTDIDICKFDIYPVGYGRDDHLDYEVVRFHWKRPHIGWTELKLRQAYLTDGSREFPTAIADQGIVLFNKRQTEYFQLMLRTYMEELRQIRTMTNLYSTMGWKENNTHFVIGDTVISKADDGSVSEEQVTLSTASSNLSTGMYGRKGDAAAWTTMTNMLEKAHMPSHMFALGVGFSAPLFNFTGLKGLTISLYGPTGGGKTLAQYWIQSIYGDPDKLHFAAKFTQNTLFNRMGLYAHLPMTIDEVTMMQDKEVGDFCYWVSQGKDKARLSRSAVERDTKTWATPVVVSTNKSLQSKLIASGLDTDAQMARLLEVTVPPHELFTKSSSAGRNLYNFVTNNYGHAGHTFINKLMEIGSEDIRAMVAEATDTFHKRYGAEFSGQERFWEQAIILSDLASKLAKDWGLIDYDYTKGTEWVLEQIGAIRIVAEESKMDSFDIISAYLSDFADVAVTVMHTAGQKPVVDFQRLPRGEIRVRFDVFRKTMTDVFSSGTLMLDRTHFRKWLSMSGHDYKSFCGELTCEHIDATPKSKKCFLGKNTPIKLGQAYVVGINLNHPRLQGILDDADVAAEDLLQGQLQMVN